MPIEFGPLPVPTVVFLSGSGRTLENLIKHVHDGALPIDIRLVISSAAGVRGLEIARAANRETRVICKSSSVTAYSENMFAACRDVQARLVVMAGFLKHVLIPDDFIGRVINIHPSLLPAFGGEGMYGMKVHEAAIARGVQFSGCTVHFVDNQYDHGPIILQRQCSVLAGCTAEALAAQVFALECEALPTAIQQICEPKWRTFA